MVTEMSKNSVKILSNSKICLDIVAALNLRDNWWDIVRELEKEASRDKQDVDSENSVGNGIWVILSSNVSSRFKKLKADQQSVNKIRNTIQRVFLEEINDIRYAMTVEYRDPTANLSGLVNIKLELSPRGEVLSATATSMDSKKLASDWIDKQNTRGDPSR
jgi:hypothetical protein